MYIKDTIKDWVLNNWFIALFLLGIYFITHGYRYGWDDQALEIPLLKSLIDPGLYSRDYYVQSLKGNFTTFFYPLLASCIKVKDIPAVYLFLFVVSRYFLFFWTYKLWEFISKDKFKAFLCTLTVVLVLRVQDFLYLSFSHQEFVLPFVFSGLYFFYKDKYLLSAVLLGVAANFHALYSFYPATYLFIFLLISHKKNGFKVFLKSFILYAFFASPFIIWTVKRSFAPGMALPLDWVTRFKMASPESFIFGGLSPDQIFGNIKNLLFYMGRYIFIITLYIFNCAFNEDFRNGLKNHVIIASGIVMLILGYILGDVLNVKFILMMLFSRNKHFLDFFLGGFFVLTALNITDTKSPWIGLIMGLIMLFLSLKNIFISIIIVISALLLILEDKLNKKDTSKLKNVIIICFISIITVLFYLLVKIMILLKYNPFGNAHFFYVSILLSAILIICYLPFPKIRSNCPLIKRAFIIIPFMLCLFLYGQYHYKKRISQKSGYGLLQQQWEDIQYFVQENTPKTALLLVPYDMPTGGFRIHSQRSIVCSERDKGIISFDFNALYEWQKRKNDINDFSIKNQGPVSLAVMAGINKYHVDYIVFANNKAPKSNNVLQRIYYNKAFSLYRVNRS